MKIKRLEISGFKSFADRVVLDFQEGVTGVVGPNGCGKSNIVDAIRWCMGEQSAKNLRGKAMEDIIFAGSESRKPLGLAEVSLIFSTEDGLAPAKFLDYGEIQLTRRLYRDGESEYLLNKTPCRLLDITELFMDTGVGTKAYSIIEQGKIGQILHSRPEERRLLIEEAAGVTRYKARKQLALKKIEGTRQNLLRLNDLIGEIKRQLGSLQRQAKKAEKFKEYRQELRELERRSIMRRALLVQAERTEAEQGLALLNEQMQLAFAAVAQAENRLEEERLALFEAEKQLNTVQEELFRLRSDTAACENGLIFRRREQDTLAERLLRLDQELRSLSEGKETASAQLIETQQQQQQVAQCLTEAAAALLAAQQALQEQEEQFESANSRLEQGRRELFAALAEVSHCRTQIDGISKRLLQMEELLQRHELEKLRLTERMATLTGRKNMLEEQLAAQRAGQRQIAAEIERLAEQERLLKSQAPILEKRWQTCHDSLNRTASRLTSLQELEAQFEGYGQGVRVLLKDAPLRERLGGMLADLLDVPAELEAALEAVLGERLQMIICRDPADAMESLAYLRSHGGRASLALPGNGSAAGFKVVDGRVVPLLTKIILPESLNGLMSRLLSETYCVADLETALELGSTFPEATFVTGGGDLVTLGGVISGGSAELVQSGIIHKKREIKLLEEQRLALQAELDLHEEERKRLQETVQEVTQTVAEERTRLHRGELSLAGLVKDQQQVAGDISQTEERIKLNMLELASLADEQQSQQQELERLTQVLQNREQEVQHLEAELATSCAGIEEQRRILAAAREQLTTLRVSEATLREQSESLQRSTKATATRLQEFDQRCRQGAADRQGAEEQRQDLALEIAAEEQRLKELLSQQLTLDGLLRTTRANYEVIVAKLSGSDAALRSCRAESETVRQRQSELTLRCSALAMQLENLDQNLQERHRITIAEMAEHADNTEFDEAAVKTRQQELEQLLEELGEVNLMAIEECACMEERYNFLTAQKADLEESVQDLQQAIQKINKTTRKRFFDTFTRINSMFSEIFPRLFCGGQAELRLTDEQDLLETGIDIIVQPPGKKLSNVMLLSGGEKALTAVALIFAIFLIKPTPFCLLDEVDAPLDDANIGRFNEMVREMSAISQFIIITHNKTTMGVADTLYGVTMEEPGASRIVSVKLH